MRYVEAPDNPELDLSYKRPFIFLAGTITGAKNWQLELTEKLNDLEVTIFNPRWSFGFPMEDPGAARKQIEWEYQRLELVDLVSFYFPAEGLSPITLYELGKTTALGRPIEIAIEPGFWREEDVRIQTDLMRPGIHIGSSLDELANMIERFVLHVERRLK